MRISANIKKIRGIGDKLAQHFDRIEIHTVEDLLLNFPRKYIDLTKDVAISDLEFEYPKPFIATVTDFQHIRLRGRGNKTLQKATLRDKEGETVQAVWFNFNFLQDALKVDKDYAFVGKLSENKRGEVQLSTPDFEKLEGERIHTQGFVPIYHLTKGLTPKAYRRFVKTALEEVTDLEQASNIEYETITQLNNNSQEKIVDFSQAIAEIHFPTTKSKLDAAKLRLALEELVPIQRKIVAEIKSQKSKDNPLANHLRAISDNDNASNFEKIFTKFWQENYPFDPTKDQTQTAKDIFRDFGRDFPALRLIQGDVGTGKTAVASFACHLCLDAGKDVAIMAPTTVLAEQHYQKFSELFPEVKLVTSATDVGKNSSNREQNLSEPRIFIGTQALLVRAENLNLDLGLVIVDEEHRFGVKQRNQLVEFGEQGNTKPHYLKLSATPIPRTLAQSIFGQIEISTLTTKPGQQQPRQTYLVPEHKREDAYSWIKNEIEAGEQVFWVVPLIEELKQTGNDFSLVSRSETASIKTVKSELSKKLPDIELKTLHGKLKDSSKGKILSDFKQGRFQLLISTTVIEVGIDIPSANLIVIEDAYRFGLAQLHQLRGRVGRGEKPGRCLVFTGGETASERLQFFSSSEDGLKLAEYDLEQRGPGEVYGKIQSGIPNLQIADLSSEKQVNLAAKIVEIERK